MPRNDFPAHASGRQVRHVRLIVAAALLLSGVVYAADPAHSYAVSTLAGTPGTAGLENGSAATAKFNRPTWLDVVTDASDYENTDTGDIFVVDRANQLLRKITHGTVSTYSVTDGYSIYMPSGNPFPFDFGGPFGGGVLIEPPSGGCGGDVYARGMFVASSGGEQVALVSFWGVLANRDGHDVLGTANTAGTKDGSHYEALFHTPTGLARSLAYGWSNIDERKLFVADAGNHTIRRVGFAYSGEGCPQTSTVETFAGMAGVAGSADGVRSAARFNSPRGIVTAPDGSLLVADSGNHTVRRIAADGTVTTIAGVAGVAGHDDGLAVTAHLNTPSGIDVDARGEIFVADTGNHVIRMITSDGQLVTIAGLAGVAAYADGIGSAARFSGPVGIRVVANGAIVVADTSNNVIRLLAPAGSRRRATQP
jgi:methylmalonyl-CoA mutase cobalamin-binding subunit